jgi:uncharacterized protein YndB with AHSA1/START domain
MNDRIEKQIELKAPVSRVWKALTDYREFGQWFRVNLESPFIAGQVTKGPVTKEGYEHLVCQMRVQQIESEKYFSFTWHPYAVDSAIDYSNEEPTLVEFTLTPTAGGTLLKLVESGFEKLPAHRRVEAFRMNNGGWDIQMQNIARHVG